MGEGGGVGVPPVILLYYLRRAATGGGGEYYLNLCVVPCWVWMRRNKIYSKKSILLWHHKMYLKVSNCYYLVAAILIEVHTLKGLQRSKRLLLKIYFFQLCSFGSNC